MTGESVTVRVQLPHHLRNLAGVEGEVTVELAPPGLGASTGDATDGATGDAGRRPTDVPAPGPTIADLLDALEARFPALEGTIRDHDGGPRRAYLRFFTCGEDVSHRGEDFALPRAVVEGREVFRVVGAISGG